MKRALFSLSLVALSIMVTASVFAELLAGNTPLFWRDEQGFFFLPIVTRPNLLAGAADTESGWFVWWLFATRHSFGSAAVSGLIALLLGTGLGASAAFGPSALDALLARLVEFGTALPSILLAPILVLTLDIRLTTALILAISLAGTLEIARIVRGLGRAEQQRGFVLASGALGGARAGALKRHLLVSLLEALVLATSMTVGALVGLDAALHLLDLVEVPQVSWGAALMGRAAPLRQMLAAVSVVASVVSLYVLGHAAVQRIADRAHA